MLQLDRHVPSPGVPELNRRFKWLVAVVASAFLILVGRLWQLQIIEGERHFQRSTDNFRAEQWIPAVRGKILDRNGTILVDNRPSFNVYVTPRTFTPETRLRLARLLGLGQDEVTSLAVKVGRAKNRLRPHLVLEDIERDRLALIAQASAELPGVTAEDVPHRHYLHGKLAGHLLGYMNQIGEAELEVRRDEGYDEGEYIGRSGLERQWERYLRGQRGIERFVVDARGQRQSDVEALALIEGPRLVPPVPGHNLVLTLDAELQRLAEEALADRPAGAAAVVEVATGRILALVSRPAFDPNQMTGRLTRAEEAMLEGDPLKPFLDRTLRQHYFPGSTFKVFTALAALEAGAYTPQDRVYCDGTHELGKRTFRCHKAHGWVDLNAALAQSCDTYFWQVSERIGIDRIADMAKAFGLGSPTGLGLNGDVPGNIPTRAWYATRGGFRPGFALNTAIGQGDTTVTVLQLALAFAALANGGDLWVPQIALRVESAAGKVVADFPPRLRAHVELSRRALTAVQRGLVSAVNEKKGTAYASRDPHIVVAGKTGTAQVGKLYRKIKEVDWDPTQDHAWFAGYAPAHRPQIAFVVLVEHGGGGGRVAAPPAMKIVRAALGDGATAWVEAGTTALTPARPAAAAAREQVR
jgi:penicillin-binding protein 2